MRALSRSMPDTTGPNHSAAEAAATQHSSKVEKIAPDPPAIRSCRQEPDVTGQSSKVPCVVSQPLQFQGDAANRLRTDRGGAFG